MICVEPNDKCVDVLQENTKANKWNISVLPKPFGFSMRSGLNFDHMKMDCEHCEEAFLELRTTTFPCAFEVHSEETTKELKDRLRFDLRKRTMKHK